MDRGVFGRLAMCVGILLFDALFSSSILCYRSAQPSGERHKASSVEIQKRHYIEHMTRVLSAPNPHKADIHQNRLTWSRIHIWLSLAIVVRRINVHPSLHPFCDNEEHYNEQLQLKSE